MLNINFFRANVLRCVLSLSCFFAAAPASAEWLSLFEPVNSALPIAAGAGVAGVNDDVGRDAFMSFGCGECHAKLQSGSYEVGIRILQNVRSNVTTTLEAAMRPQKSPRVYTEAKTSLMLGAREYVQSLDNSAIYLRKIHQDIPGFEPSLMLLKAANPSEQAAAVDYILVF